MSNPKGIPSSGWNAYHSGRASSFGSLDSVPEDRPQQQVSESVSGSVQDGGDNLRRRRSSIAMHITSLRQMGGPNNIDNFARSMRRAAGFREITPLRRGSITVSDLGGEENVLGSPKTPGMSPQHKSLLRQQFEAAGGHDIHGSAIQDQTGEQSEPNENTRLLQPPPSHSHTLSFPTSYRPSIPESALGQSYGSISTRLTATAQSRAAILIEEQQEASMRAMEDDDSEYKVDLVNQHIEQEVRPDGEVIERVCGESTVPMTIFNSTNVLIGVGILALPLGIKQSGWVLGLPFLTLAALVTNYTARLLAKCLDTNSGATTYGDIAFLAFGAVGRNIVEALFIVELTAANVALIILFGDSMYSLIPTFSLLTWKCIVALGLIPLNFAPFRILSVTSVLGIVCTLGIIGIVFVDGLIKPHSPGSIREVAKTYAFAENWRTIPLSLGLFMAPWGGHSVFPAIYKDMRHPQKYPKALQFTYIFTYGLDLTMAVLGYLMFGTHVRDEVTTNILTSRSYPHALSVLMILLIAIIPITKVPLTNRPISDTINKKFYIDLRQMDPKARKHSEKSWKHRIARGTIACSSNIIQLGIAILLPDFDSVMALMGSALCFTICVIMPVAFYLKIFSHEANEISVKERVLGWTLIVMCTIFGVMGTVFSLMPKEKLGIKH